MGLGPESSPYRPASIFGETVEFDTVFKKAVGAESVWGLKQSGLV